MGAARGDIRAPKIGPILSSSRLLSRDLEANLFDALVPVF
jgi:hypothetical protein